MGTPGRYRLTGDDTDDLWGYAVDATGLFTPDPSAPDTPYARRVVLLGCAPRGNLRRATERLGTTHASLGNAHLDFLDPSGHLLASYFANCVTAEHIQPSAADPALSDVTLTLSCGELRPHAQWPWDLIRSGRLTRNGLWHNLNRPALRAWLSVAVHRHSPRPDDPLETRYELDGSHVIDEDTFYCAIGEAVNGPGGYFGWNLDALADCTRGGFGATTPFTIVWNESATARTHLGRRTNRDDTSIFDIIMEICAQNRIEVLLR